MISYKLATEEDLEHIVVMLDEITKNLLDKGIQQWDYPTNLEEIRDDLIKRKLYIVKDGEELIGTFSIGPLSQVYPVKEMNALYMYRIAITPEQQGRKLGHNIIKFAKDYAKKNHTTLFLDCWSGNEKLKEFYSQSGIDYLGDYKESNYYISVFKIN